MMIFLSTFENNRDRSRKVAYPVIFIYFQILFGFIFQSNTIILSYETVGVSPR